jgi:hypothetical protein
MLDKISRFEGNRPRLLHLIADLKGLIALLGPDEVVLKTSSPD